MKTITPERQAALKFARRLRRIINQSLAALPADVRAEHIRQWTALELEPVETLGQRQSFALLNTLAQDVHFHAHRATHPTPARLAEAT